MADQALINASKGATEQFVDYGATFAKATSGIMKQIVESDNRMAKFIDNIPPDGNIEKLPEGMRPEVERYLRDSKAEYAELAKTASKLNPSDSGYREAVEGMNKIKRNFQSLNKNLESHLANRVEFIGYEGDFSTSLPNNDKVFLQDTYAGDYTGFKISEGNLDFLDKSTNTYRNQGDFPKYSLSDAIGGNGVQAIFDKEVGRGATNKPFKPEVTRRSINSLFKDLKSQGIIDLAFDGMDSSEFNFVDGILKEKLGFGEMSQEEWLVSEERENLKTKEGFAEHSVSFEDFILEAVKEGHTEGQNDYTTKINDQNKRRPTIPVNYGDNNYITTKSADLLLEGIRAKDSIQTFDAQKLVYDADLDTYIYEELIDGKKIPISNREILEGHEIWKQGYREPNFPGTEAINSAVEFENTKSKEFDFTGKKRLRDIKDQSEKDITAIKNGGDMSKKEFVKKYSKTYLLYKSKDAAEKAYDELINN